MLMLTDPLAPVEEQPGQPEQPAESSQPVESAVPAPPPIPVTPSAPPAAAPAPNASPSPKSGGGKFDFIMNNKPGGKTNKPQAGSSAFTRRLIFAASGGVVLVLIAIVFFSFLGSVGKGDIESLVVIAQEQQEIDRVASIGLAKSDSISLKNFAVTAELSTKTNQNALISMISARGDKKISKELGGKKDSNTDTLLTTSTQNNTFNTTFLQILNGLINDYRNDLSRTYKSSTNNSEKKLLKTSFDQADLLVKNKVSQ